MKIRDVVHIGRRRRKSAAQHLFDRGFVHARPDPVGAHVLGCRRMVLDRVLHGERAGEHFSIARYKPNGIIPDLALRHAVGSHEVFDDGGDELDRKTVQIGLRRMLDPMSTPIIVNVARSVSYSPPALSAKSSAIRAHSVKEMCGLPSNTKPSAKRCDAVSSAIVGVSPNGTVGRPPDGSDEPHQNQPFPFR